MDSMDKQQQAGLRTRAHARDGSGAIERTVSAILRVMERAERVETMMAEAVSPSAITLQLMNDGLTKTQAHRYQRAVRMRWERIGRSETSEQRLQRYRRIAEHGIEQAARSKRMEYVGKDDDGKPLYEEVERYDARAVAALLAILVKLEGDGGAEARRIAEIVAKLGKPGITEEDIDALAQEVGWKLAS